MPKTYTERAGERITLDYPVPVTRPPNARTGERPADQVAAARLHEFHPAPPPHEQWMHGRRRAPGATVPTVPKAARRRAPKAPAAPAALTGEARIEAARNRQKKIDIARGKAEKLATLTELIYNDAEPDVFEHNLNRMNLAEDPAMKELLRPDNRSTPQKLLKAIDRVGRKLKLEPIRGTKTVRVRNQHGEFDVDRAPFNRDLHTLLGDEGNVPVGTEVDIAQPGYFADIDGERLRLFRAKVMTAVDEVVPPAPKRTRAPKRSQTAAVVRMHEFHPAPPPHVQSSHGNRGGSKAVSVPDARTPKALRARAPKAATGKPKLTDLVRKQKASDEATVAAANKIWGGTFGGLTAKVTKSTPIHLGSGPKGNRALVVEGVVTDASGREVGKFLRSLSAGRGKSKAVARHSALGLEPGVRGQGFAEGFNANAIDWYRANDVGSIELHANVDVGGYAWARAGYDWDDESSSRDVLTAVLAASGEPSAPSSVVMRENVAKIPADRLVEQQKLADEMFGRGETAEFGEVGYPTPYEISQLGRWPGAGKDDMWIGKAIMLGSSWHGVRYL